MSHRPDRYGARLFDLENVFPGIYEHPEYYSTGDFQSDLESLRVILNSYQHKENLFIKVYRATALSSRLHDGDWVTLSENYARQHAMIDDNPEHDWPVISQLVPAEKLTNDGNSINEFGYFVQ